MQSVFKLNAAARLVYSSRRYDHVTPLLHELHWLRMSQRNEHKLAVLVYRCLNGLAPSYLASDLQRVADLGARRRLRSASTSTLVVPVTCLSKLLSVTVRFRWLRPVYGTVCRPMSLRRHHCRHFRDVVCSELLIAPAASDTLFFTVRAARTCFRFFVFLSSVRCPSSL